MEFRSTLTLCISVFTTIWLGWNVVKYMFPWIIYEVRFVKIIFGTTRLLSRYKKRTPPYTIVDKLVDEAEENPSNPYVLFEDDVWTYKDLNEYSNQVARVMHQAGAEIDVTVSLMMKAQPQLLGILFGVAKTGATTALINHNMRHKSLLHLLEVADSKILIISNEKEVVQAVSEIEEDLERREMTVYVLGDVEGVDKLDYKPLHTLLKAESKQEAPPEWRKDITFNSHFGYIYTSGTTGLPKAGVLKYDRAWLYSRLGAFGDITRDDVMYVPLPLYHASALAASFGALRVGGAVILRRKFSASEYWADCRRYKATVVWYVGEVMRYVCSTPEHPDDKNHTVRLAIGNGMRPHVWKKLLERFGKKIRVMEFYSASEANVGFVNMDGHLGSIGSYNPLTKATGAKLIKYDQEKEKPYRAENGRCVEVPPNTSGLLVAKISETFPFHGYRGEKELTEKKILRNVTMEGDAYFNTGDLLRYDQDRHLYFLDRTGDTYRWKGENISTQEVADVMSSAPGIKEACVYGVEIEGNEGRAGMMVALLKVGEEFDCADIYKHACEELPPFERPLFIRIKTEMDLTGTFKHRRVQLVREGFEPKNMGGDKVYFLDNKELCYVPLTQDLADDIVHQRIRI